MANPIKITRQAQVGAGLAPIHTVNAQRMFTVGMLHLVNTTGADMTVRVCFVEAGGAAQQGNSALWDFAIPANDFIELGEGQVLAGGAAIWASVSVGNAVNLFLSGMEE